MSINFRFALMLLTLCVCQLSVQARGRGVKSYLVTSEGTLAVTLGETSGDLLDPAGFVRYRYHEGHVMAVPLYQPSNTDQPNNPDQPDKVLWTANVKAVMQGRGPAWRLLPTLIVILGEDTITALDRTTGKILYATPSDHFTDSPTLARYSLADQPPSLYLIDDRALREPLRRDQPNGHPPATLARFDLASGKFLWKTAIITPAGLKLWPTRIDPRGAIRGEVEDEEFYFDPATGKAAAEASFDDNPPREPASSAPQPRVQQTDDKIEYLDAAGKVVWSRAEPGVKGDALLSGDSVIIPSVTERSTTQVLSYNIKDGTERWRCKLPGGFFADSVTVKIEPVKFEPAKTGYLVQLEWLVLD